MARSQNPMTGKMSGTVGNFVTSSLGSQNIVRAKAFTTRDAKTEAQVRQRDGFKIIADLYSTLSGILSEGFAQRSENTSAYNAFMAANLSVAIDKSGVETMLDYSKLIVSNGTLPVLNVTEANIEAAGINITYLPMLKITANDPTDEVVAVALLKTGELWVERQARGNEVSDSILIPVTNVTLADLEAVYVFVRRANGSKVSRSVFVTVTN